MHIQIHIHFYIHFLVYPYPFQGMELFSAAEGIRAAMRSIVLRLAFAGYGYKNLMKMEMHVQSKNLG